MHQKGGTVTRGPEENLMRRTTGIHPIHKYGNDPATGAVDYDALPQGWERPGRSTAFQGFEQGRYALTLVPGDITDRLRRLGDNAALNTKEIFGVARHWSERNVFLRMVLGMKKAFFNAGLRIRALDPTQKDTLEKAFQRNPLLEFDLHRYVANVWDDFLRFENVVSYWNKNQPFPFTLLPDKLDYSDKFGIEKLLYHENFTRNELQGETKEGRKLTEEEIRRWTKGRIELSAEKGDFWHVLKRGPVGSGFDPCSMASIFDACDQHKSMEVGEMLYAEAGRDVIRQHKLGHKIDSGPKAGSPKHFYNKTWAKSVKDFFEGRSGKMDFVSRFDHEIDLHWIDPKKFDADKWETVVKRVMWWAGPIGFMMVAKGVTPMLMPMLKTEAKEARRWVEMHCRHVLLEAGVKIPPVKLTWDNRVFSEQRLSHEMMKFLVQQGPLSLRSALEEMGFDQDVEMRQKKTELEEPELHKPLFDAAHGEDPAGPEPGRPEGAPDPTD